MAESRGGGGRGPSVEKPRAGLVVKRELACAIAGHPDAHHPQEHGQPRRERALTGVKHCLRGLRLQRHKKEERRKEDRRKSREEKKTEE